MTTSLTQNLNNCRTLATLPSYTEWLKAKRTKDIEVHGIPVNRNAREKRDAYRHDIAVMLSQLEQYPVET